MKFMDLVEANHQRAAELQKERIKRRKRLGLALIAGATAVMFTKNKNTLNIKFK